MFEAQLIAAQGEAARCGALIPRVNNLHKTTKSVWHGDAG